MNEQTGWTLGQEICRIGGSEDFRHALVSLGLVETALDAYSIRTDEAWTPGGAETYI
jgi:hypothetical protein